MLFRKAPLFLLAVLLLPAISHAKGREHRLHPIPLTPEQQQVLSQAMYNEGVLVRTVQDHTPLVETYIQETRPDEKLYAVPVSDSYMLNRVDFDRDFFDVNYAPRGEHQQSRLHAASASALAGITHALHLDTSFALRPLAFTEMMLFNPAAPEFKDYTFSYVRREFLGSVRTMVFDVEPKHRGHFLGRIWIEDKDCHIVRLNGTFSQDEQESDRPAHRLVPLIPIPFGSTPRPTLHFDSWRANVRPGIWLPVAVYVEETHWRNGHEKVALKAQTRFWGFSLREPSHDSENVSLRVDDAEDKSAESGDVSPLQAQRAWITQAEDNVVERMVKAGLVAPLVQDGYEQKILDQIVTNIAVPNNLAFTEPVRCRILLTTTIEATTAGNTILISKGLLDSMPSEEAIASVVSLELAHIVLGHRIDTRYAFNDRLMFPDEVTFRRIDMYHSDKDNEMAAKRAMQYMQGSMYKDKLPSAGLFWEQLADRGKVLHQLTTPRIGDSMLRADGSPWMAELARSAPKINWDDLQQVAALPLGSWLKTDPWDDSVHMLSAKRYAPMNPGEKLPLELTPVYFQLQRAESQPEQAKNPPPPPDATRAATQ